LKNDQEKSNLTKKMTLLSLFEIPLISHHEKKFQAASQEEK